eukprot:2174045-Amphidinium_carterae.1
MGRLELLSMSSRLPEIGSWAEVPAQLKREPLRMHCNLGHLECSQMMRMLSRAGAKKERKFPQPVKTGVNEYCFGLRLAIDVLSVKDAENQVHRYLNILDLGTHYQVCAYLGPGVGVTTSQLVLRTFVRSWIAWAGWPQQVRLDLGKEFTGEFAQGLTAQGVDLDVVPLESPHQQGEVEKAGGLWKAVMAKVVVDGHVVGEKKTAWSWQEP